MNAKLMLLVIFSLSPGIVLSTPENKLLDALEHNSPVDVLRALKAGADVNVSFFDGSLDGATALMIAARGGLDKIVGILLIQKGIEINKTDRTGKTALMYALGNEKYDMVKALLKAGANVNIADRQGETALIKAWSHPLFIVKLLLEAGADANVKNKFGKTALDYAKLGNTASVIKLLQENMAS